MQLDRKKAKAACVFSYENAVTYQSNFERAYRDLVQHDATA